MLHSGASEQFLQVRRLYRTLSLHGLAVCLVSASVSSVFMMSYVYSLPSLPFSELSLVGLVLDLVD